MTATTGIDRALDGRRVWLLWIAWAVVAVGSVVVAIAAFESFLGGDRPLIDTQGPLSVQPELARQLEFRLFEADVIKTSQSTVHVLGAALFSTGGVLIFLRRSRDWVVALSSATLLLVGVALFAPTSFLAISRPSWEAAVDIVGVFDAGPGFWRSLAGGAALLFAFLFPDGRFVPAWTKGFTAAYGAFVALWVAFPSVDVFNVAKWPSGARPAWTLGLAVVAVYAQLDRYVRFSGPETRKQTRLVVVSLTAIVGSFLLIWLLDPGLSRSVDFGLVLVTERTQAIYDLNVLSLLTIGVVLFPVSIGVSVARYRLWDMDLIINRALVYGSTTAIIGVVLLGVAVFVGNAVEGTFGRSVGIGISGVLMAALFQPLRARVQAAIDRRFYPQKYDAERTLETLADGLRDETDLERVRSAVLATIDETLQPATAHLALPSIDTSYEADRRLLGEVFAAEANRPITTSSELLPDDAVAAFRLRSIEVIVPLVSHGELAGVLELGPRLDGGGYAALDQQLLRQLADRTAPVIRYAEIVAREAQERAARQAYERELQLAEQIQRDLLPRRLPDLDGWELGARYEPSRQVSGDLYDFIHLADGRLGIVIADVTDKGVPAAMVMATTRSVLRAAASSGDDPSPGDVLARVNRLLLPDIPENMFVTCFYAVLDPSTGRLVFANAGQNLPMLRSRDTVTELMARGMPLGLMESSTYEEDEVLVGPGDAVLLYSDGLVEAHGPGGEMFGKPRVLDRVRNHAGGPDLLDYLVESLIGFAGREGARDDDVTLVALRRLDEVPTGAEGLGLLGEFSLPSELGGELEAIRRLDGVLAGIELDERTHDRLRTAVGEATMNAMEHGNGYDPNLAVGVTVRADESRVEVSITDFGQEVPPLDTEPDLDAKLSGEQSPRGWGLFLIRNMVDELSVDRIGDQNRMTLVIERQRAL